MLVSDPELVVCNKSMESQCKPQMKSSIPKKCKNVLDKMIISWCFSVNVTKIHHEKVQVVLCFLLQKEKHAIICFTYVLIVILCHFCSPKEWLCHSVNAPFCFESLVQTGGFLVLSILSNKRRWLHLYEGSNCVSSLRVPLQGWKSTLNTFSFEFPRLKNTSRAAEMSGKVLICFVGGKNYD